MTDEKERSGGSAITPDREEGEESGSLDLLEELEDTPPQIRRMVQGMMAVSTSRSRSYHPIFEKFNEEHVTKFLEYSHSDDQNSYDLYRSNRWFHLTYVVIGVSLFIFLVVFLIESHPDLLGDLFKIVVAFLGGLGSGYGIKAYRDARR